MGTQKSTWNVHARLRRQGIRVELVDIVLAGEGWALTCFHLEDKHPPMQFCWRKMEAFSGEVVEEGKDVRVTRRPLCLIIFIFYMDCFNGTKTS